MDTDGSKEGWSSNHTGDDTEDARGSSKNKSGIPSGEDGEDGEPSDLWLVGILSPLPVYTLYVVVEFFYPYSDITPTLGLLTIIVHVGGVVSLIIDVSRIGDTRNRDTGKIKIIGIVAVGSFALSLLLTGVGLLGGFLFFLTMGSIVVILTSISVGMLLLYAVVRWRILKKKG